MQILFQHIRLIRVLLLLMVIPLSVTATALGGPANQNIIPNGDFSKGNTGFSSGLPYIAPADNCLWGSYYTVAQTFNDPQLHRLIARQTFPAAMKRTGKEKVLFANAGGADPVVVWSAEVKCRPNTRYLLSFYCISLSGYIEDGNPPHQVATKEWASDFEIWANNQPSAPVTAGCGTYSKRSIVWDSKDATSASLKIVRAYFPHGGGLYGISNVEMVPMSGRS